MIYDEGRAPDVPQLNEVGKPTSQKTKAPIKAGSAAWLVAALLLLSAIPLAAGAFRLTQLAGGAEITPANARFFASPLPVVLHIVSAAVYAILGAFQFAPGFRRRMARLAPRGRAARGSLRAAGWAFRAVDDPVLSLPGWRRCAAVCLAAPVWVGHGRVHRPRLCRDPATGRDPAPRMDDARLRASGLARARRC